MLPFMNPDGAKHAQPGQCNASESEGHKNANEVDLDLGFLGMLECCYYKACYV